MHRSKVIEQLVKKFGWTRGAELGVWQGKTYLPLLKNCPDLTLIGVDLWETQFDNPEYVKQYGEQGWDHASHEKTVRAGAAQFGERAIIYKGFTWDIAPKIEDNSLDFIFIDADHASEAVRRDITDWSPKVKEGGYIIGHDIDWPSVKKIVVEKFGFNYTAASDNVWYTIKE
tara:strand:+ start:1481 stop:1996 length:516 start_codon:yes stop_codon:yes gene_type:complete